MPADDRKVCAYCQQDCSAKARTKDAQGRYFCKECFPRAQAGEKQKAAAAPGRTGGASVGVVGGASVFDDPVLLTPELIAPKEQPRRPGVAEVVKETPMAPCPSCGIQSKADAVVCTNCGFNRATQKAVKTKVEKPLVIKDPKARRSGGGIDFPSVVVIVAGLAMLAGGIGVALGQSGTEGATELGIAGILLGVVITHLGAVVTAAMNDGLIWALVLLLVPFGAVYWALVKCEHTGLKVLYLIAMVLGIGANLIQKAEKLSLNDQPIPGLSAPTGPAPAIA